jgi:hypothetical protein
MTGPKKFDPAFSDENLNYCGETGEAARARWAKCEHEDKSMTFKRNWLTAFCLATALIFTASAFAQIPMTGAGKGSPTTAPFQGAGDIVASADWWYGLRAYSAAKRGNAAISICEPTGVTCVDWGTDAVTGNLVHGTNPGGTDCTSVNTCTIAKIYDQTQGNKCAGATSCDLVGSGTNANRFTFTWNCQNGHPCLKRTGGSAGIIPAQSSPAYSVTFPSTVTGVGLRNSTSGSGNTFFQFTSVYFAWDSSANLFDIYAGTFVQTAASDAAIHAMIGIYNGASSVLDVDVIGGTTGNAGGATSGAGIYIWSDSTGINNPPNGNFYEGGLWPIAFTGGGGAQQSNMLSNMRTYWGF